LGLQVTPPLEMVFGGLFRGLEFAKVSVRNIAELEKPFTSLN